VPRRQQRDQGLEDHDPYRKSLADAAETTAKADEAYWLRALRERGPNDPETVAAAELKEKSATAAVKARQALQAAEDKLAGLQGKVCPPLARLSRPAARAALNPCLAAARQRKKQR